MGRIEAGHIVHRLHQRDRALRQLAHGAENLGMPGMADQHDLAPGGLMAPDLDMDLGDQWARGVQVEHVAPLRLGRHRLGHAVGGEDDRTIARRFFEMFDEHRAEPSQPVDDVGVVDDLVAHIDRRAILQQRLLDDLNRAVHPSTKAAWTGQQDVKRRKGGIVGAHAVNLGSSRPRRQGVASIHPPQCAASEAVSPRSGVRDQTDEARIHLVSHATSR